MSFSNRMKQEICENKAYRRRWKTAHAYGLFLFSRSCSAQEMSFHTEHEECALQYEWLARSLLGKDADITSKEKSLRGKRLFETTLPQAQDRQKILELFGRREGINCALLRTPEDVGAFLAGAFLACGNVTNPEKSYHMEFVVREESLCRALICLLEEHLPGVKSTIRRGQHVVYYKECGQIEDLMTMMGAVKSCLVMIDVELIKSVRNQANRATNCETANIDKLVSAASAQVEDIRLVLETAGEQALPDNLLQVARLRLEHPELSLRELAEVSRDPISRSGMHHRLDKISKMAAEIRGENGKETGNA